MENITLGAAIIGIINGIQKQFPQVTGIYAWVVAIVIGAVAGYLNFEGLTVQQGILIGLGSSGVYKTAQLVGNK